MTAGDYARGAIILAALAFLFGVMLQARAHHCPPSPLEAGIAAAAPVTTWPAHPTLYELPRWYRFRNVLDGCLDAAEPAGAW